MSDLSELGDEFYLYDGSTLYGRCSYCQRRVDNYDPQHRVTAIALGGKGVECALRGDICLGDAAPLADAAVTEASNFT